MLKKIIVICGLCFLGLAAAQPTATVTPPPAEQVFKLQVTLADSNALRIHFDIAPGFELYKHNLQFKILKPTSVETGIPLWPKAIEKIIPTIGTLLVYQGAIDLELPLINLTKQTQAVTIQISYQGCSTQGFCYAPMQQIKQITLPNGNTIATTATKHSAPPTHTQLLSTKHIALSLLSFFGLGILISLTPCVLPMIPVLLGILVGHHKSKHSPFSLALCYVLGMALTYAIVGMLFSYIGLTLQSLMQQPSLIIALSLLFVAMALSLFGAYNLTLPQPILNKLNRISEHQTRGSLIGATIMGCLATLILSPCVTPPLVAVLAYISHQGNLFLGTAALFSMGIGIGIPLLFLGLIGPRILPQSGKWMSVIKNLMGILLLAMAIWMIQRFLPGNTNMLLWAALACGSAWYLGAFRSSQNSFQTTEKIIGIILLLYGITLLVGFVQQRNTPLHPIQLSRNTQTNHQLNWISVSSVDDLNRALTNPQYKNQPILMDFYATWCISCHEIDHLVFNNQQVQQQLRHMVLLRVDVTTSTPKLQALQQHLNVIAPPTLLIFNAHHDEITDARIIGNISAQAFLTRLQKALTKPTSTTSTSAN